MLLNLNGSEYRISYVYVVLIVLSVLKYFRNAIAQGKWEQNDVQNKVVIGWKKKVQLSMQIQHIRKELQV